MLALLSLSPSIYSHCVGKASISPRPTGHYGLLPPLDRFYMVITAERRRNYRTFPSIVNSECAPQAVIAVDADCPELSPVPFRAASIKDGRYLERYLPATGLASSTAPH